MRSNISWSHRFSPRLGTTLAYNFSRSSTRSTPYWENRLDVSEAAGINYGSPTPLAPMDWGPPALSFSSGIYGLTDAQAFFNRNRTEAIAPSVQWSHRGHNLTLGVDFRRQEYNYLQQQNARGSFGFSGVTTGSDLADFLIGAPYTSALSTGNADKYLRESVYDAYVADDWRVSPQFTLSLGVRWEYGAPITELKNRLANLDIAPGFAAVSTVVGGTPTGPLSGQQLPNSLVRPDKTHVQPRMSLSWRPIPGSSLVVRAGYGIYADTSVYQSAALQMAQQAARRQRPRISSRSTRTSAWAMRRRGMPRRKKICRDPCRAR
jgi:outer membrane receptor protein involved in Fe transport